MFVLVVAVLIRFALPVITLAAIALVALCALLAGGIAVAGVWLVEAVIARRR